MAVFLIYFLLLLPLRLLPSLQEQPSCAQAPPWSSSIVVSSQSHALLSALLANGEAISFQWPSNLIVFYIPSLSIFKCNSTHYPPSTRKTILFSSDVQKSSHLAGFARVSFWALRFSKISSHFNIVANFWHSACLSAFWSAAIAREFYCRCFFVSKEAPLSRTKSCSETELKNSWAICEATFEINKIPMFKGWFHRFVANALTYNMSQSRDWLI